MEEIFVPLCRKSTRLSGIVNKYDLAFKEDEERSYKWVDKMVEKVIKEDRSRVNLSSLAAGSEAAANPKKQPAAPGTTGGTPGGTGPASSTDPAKPKGGKDKDGKGKKGKDQDGKKGKGKDSGGKNATGASPGGDSTPKQPPDPNRSCILNLFGKCKHGAFFGKGVKCEKGVHRKNPLESDKSHPFFKNMEKEHGTWAPGVFKYPDGSVAAPAKQLSGVGTNGNAGDTPPSSPVAGQRAQQQGGDAR